METTANRIKKAMDLRDMRQADLAEKTKISKGALSSYITGRYTPKQNNIYLIAKALNVNEAWLMGYDVPMERNSQTEEPSLTAKDERDIAKDLENIMRKLTTGEAGPAAYDGEVLDPEAAELFKDELEIALRRLKMINKEKYTPKKYKK